MSTYAIKKIPGIPGVYGDRFQVNTNDIVGTGIFKVLSIWTTNSKKENDGSITITYELPLGQHIEDNPLVMYYLKDRLEDERQCNGDGCFYCKYAETIIDASGEQRVIGCHYYNR